MRKLRALVCLMSVLMMLVGSFAANAAEAGKRPVQPAQTDGEMLFAGLFLGQQPVADQFPEVWGHPALADSVKKLRDPRAVNATKTLMKLMREQDPMFFETFALDLRSGDPVRVNQALDEAVVLSRGVAEHLLAEAKKSAETRSIDPKLIANFDHSHVDIGTNSAVVVVVAAELALAVQAVAVVQVVAVLELYKVAVVAENYAFVTSTAAIKENYWVIKYDDVFAYAMPGGDKPAPSLARDMYVGLVTERLSK